MLTPRASVTQNYNLQNGLHLLVTTMQEFQSAQRQISKEQTFDRFTIAISILHQATKISPEAEENKPLEEVRIHRTLSRCKSQWLFRSAAERKRVKRKFKIEGKLVASIKTVFETRLKGKLILIDRQIQLLFLEFLTVHELATVALISKGGAQIAQEPRLWAKHLGVLGISYNFKTDIDHPREMYKQETVTGIRCVFKALIDRVQGLDADKIVPRTLRKFRLPLKVGSYAEKLKTTVAMDVSYNFLQSIPAFPWFWNHFSHITFLNLSHNRLHVLPAAISVLQLRQFYCSENYLTSLPQLQLNRLTHIDLAKNLFTEIPPIVFQATNLTSLFLEELPIQSLSTNIGNLRKLERFWSHDCQLKDLPESLWTLQNLVELHVSGNKVEHLSRGILQLTKLRNLSLAGNPWNEESEKLIAEVMEKIP